MKVCIVSHKYAVPLDDPCCFSLGLMYVSARVKALGCDVKVLNYNLHDYDFESEVKGQDVVMFTGHEEFYHRVCRDAEICRQLGVRTVIGGAMASFMPAVMANHCDTVVVGEGDGVIAKAVNNTGIIDGNGVEWWKVRPDYEGFEIDEYHRRHNMRYMGVMASRGCPYHCTFCAQTCTYSHRPIPSLMAEIDDYVRDYKLEMIVFYDNTLNANIGYFDQVIAEMKSRHVEWSASIRLDNLTEDTVRRMKASGCRYLVVGVESFLQDRLDRMNKRITVNEITQGLDWLHEYDITYHGNILFGLDGESMKDVRRELAVLNDKYNLFPTLVRPFIGIKERGLTDLSPSDRRLLTAAFNDYITRSGKYTYPEIPQGVPRG